jgi:hypothetical protein
MLRSAMASRAVVQEGEWIMTKAKLGPVPTARPGAEQRRYVVVNYEADAWRASESSLV